MKVFISYGHDHYAVVAERLKEDLKAHGFDAWYDRDRIEGGSVWELKIENAIKESKSLLLLMSTHSMRRPDGVCIDEVSYARGHKKYIVPLMIEKVEPPLCIASLHYINLDKLCSKDGKINEDLYKKSLTDIIKILKKEMEIKGEGTLLTLKTFLEPLDNDVYIDTYKSKLVGRKWLFDAYEAWIKDRENEPKVFILQGKPGTGKSTFVANLYPYKEICGVHFCKYNNSDRKNGKKIIMSLAYHLATQVPEYAEILVGLQDLGSLKQKNVIRLFEYLFIEPLAKIERAKEDPIVLVIDALDEAGDEKNELLQVITSSFAQTPSWLKLFVTTRPEKEIVRKFKKFNPTIIDRHHMNSEDIYEYLKTRLEKNKIEHAIEDIGKLRDKCEGSFLYAVAIMDSIEKGEMSMKNIDDFPQGMDEKYESDFEHLLGIEEESIQEVAPLLEVILASEEPFSLQNIADILEIQESDVIRLHDKIFTLFPIENDVVTLIHKSLHDWLVDPDKSGIYHVSLEKGHASIYKFYEKIFKNNIFRNEYLIKHLAKHALGARLFKSAAEVLMSEGLYEKKVELMGLDSTLRTYLSELEELHKKDKNMGYAYDVMRSALFINILVKHRVFLHNSGLFFQVMNCGFDDVEKEIEKNERSILAAIGNYYYITERYKKAEPLLMKAIEMSKDYTAEDDTIFGLYNILGLCFRKYADFDNAAKWFARAANEAKDLSDYEHSIGSINYGKIEYHILNFEKALELGESALNYLKKDYENANSDDVKKARLLFIAEYHRLIAESVLWQPNLTLAKMHLDEAEKIYESEPTRDRYYVRYRYSTMLYNVLSGDAHHAIDMSEQAWEEVQSDYDKTQILYYKAFAYYCIGLEDNCIETCKKALKIAKELNIPMEIAEIETLKCLCESGAIKKHDDDVIANWCNHVGKVIIETRRKYEN